jgi:hypothetical protein
LNSTTMVVTRLHSPIPITAYTPMKYRFTCKRTHRVAYYSIYAC